jgi:hypothetical protein
MVPTPVGERGLPLWKRTRARLVSISTLDSRLQLTRVGKGLGKQHSLSDVGEFAAPCSTVVGIMEGSSQQKMKETMTYRTMQMENGENTYNDMNAWANGD